VGRMEDVKMGGKRGRSVKEWKKCKGVEEMERIERSGGNE